MAGTLGALLSGCGDVTRPEDDDLAGTPSTAAPSVSPHGWSVRDATPYARLSQSTVIDTAGDRLLMFAGEGNDAWQLPLSGTGANRWQQLSPEGQLPPPGDASAVYDASGQRVLARFDSDPRLASGTGEIWELTLGDVPTWQRLDPGGDQPTAEIASGMVALDEGGQRLFVVGGRGDHCGTWTLSLTGKPAWMRLGDAPVASCENAVVFLPEYGPAALALDAPRNRLVAVTSDGGQFWEMPLATGTWSLLTEQFGRPLPTAGFHDVAGERLLFTGDVLWSFSLATNEVTALQPQPALPHSASAVLDPERERALLVSAGAQNAVWELSLESLQAKPILKSTLGEVLDPEWTLLWDERRQAVLAFGGDSSPYARLRTLTNDAAWRDMKAGPAPPLFDMTAIYDSASQAAVAFGGHNFVSEGSDAVWRLSSRPNSQWQRLEAAGSGPEARSGAVGVYDSEQRRLIVRGGVRPRLSVFDDVWSLSLEEQAWAKLEPNGESPGARSGETGIYDPVGKRLLVYGGTLDAVEQNDVHALSLGDDPTWSKLEPSGTPPPIATWPHAARPTALHDAVRHRLVLVLPRNGTTEAFALELGHEPSWHRFCALGPSPNPGQKAQHAVLTSDGILVAFSNGAFRFNLETPYCD